MISRMALGSFLLLSLLPLARARDLPPGFEDQLVLDGLDSPSVLTFAPDGRLFVCERIKGRLLVAHYDAATDDYVLDSQPYAVFDVPHDGSGVPEEYRSSGLRGIAFDPAFETNGHVYAFYMRHEPRQNRIVRITQSLTNPDRAEPGSEVLLLEVPFAPGGASGSHNGGALGFGPDGCLYATTGDGWSGGDNVQSLSTFTGKVLRIESDGSIPGDNPFLSQTSGDLRAIYALGLRNPYTLSRHPVSNQLYINDVGGSGSNKANVYRLEAGANFGHDGYGGIGQLVSAWVHASSVGGAVLTGGAWYRTRQVFPAEYHGTYFVPLWGGNGQSLGDIHRVRGENNATVTTFATGVADLDSSGTALKPVQACVGPLGRLFYLLTTYDTNDGAVRRIRWTGQGQVATPQITPPGGSYDRPVEVTLASGTVGAVLTYTLDGSDPDWTSPIYSGPFYLHESALLKARGLHPDIADSTIASAFIEIGDTPNVPPIALAGPDQEVELGTQITLSGAGSSDPDGSSALLGFEWSQIAGQPVTLFGAQGAVTTFEATRRGVVGFELSVSDGEDTTTATSFVHVVPCVNDVLEGLVARWSMDEGEGMLALDLASGLHDGHLQGAAWSARTPYDQGGSLTFDGVSSRVIVPGLDGYVGGSSELTLAVWMRAVDFDVHDARLISKATGTAEGDHLYMLSTLASGGAPRLRFRVQTGGATSTLVASNSVLDEKTWIHTAAVYDGSTMKLYLDGVLVASQAKSGALVGARSVDVALGNQPPGAGERPFHGQLDDARIYGRALTAAEVAILASRERHEGCEGNVLPVF